MVIALGESSIEARTVKAFGDKEYVAMLYTVDKLQ